MFIIAIFKLYNCLLILHCNTFVWNIFLPTCTCPKGPWWAIVVPWYWSASVVVHKLIQFNLPYRWWGRETQCWYRWQLV